MSNVIETLADLIRINSVNPEWGGPGERGVADYVTRFFQSVGLDVIEEDVIPGRPNLMIQLPGRDRNRSVLLEVHMDTVSVDDMTIPPFEPEIRDGLMYGRGACDDKGGLATMMHAVCDLHVSGEIPVVDVILAVVADEEHHHRGVNKLIETLQASDRPLPESAIVAEPTELRVARANKGVLRFSIITRGKSAHSAKPHLGVNAITAMAPVILALEKYEAQLAENSHSLVGPATSSTGLIEGGAQINFVPENCKITIDRRLIPGEKADDVMRDYEAVLEKVRTENNEIEVRIEPANRLADEAMETPADAEVVTSSSKILDRLGLKPDPIGVPYGCDCTKLSRAGIPSVIFGPGSIDQAHGAVEFVEIDQVEKALDFYRQFLLDFGS